MSLVPEELRYTSEHEWIKKEGDTLLVGITDYAQSALGDIVFVELPEVGSALNKGDSFGVVESIKSVSDLYAPTTGEILEINSELETTPEKCNENPYEAWMIKVKLSDESEWENLMNSSSYQELLDQDQ